MAPGATFRFNTKFDQTILLGKKASNVAELCHGVRTVPDASIYFHTHRFLQQHHYLSPEPPNDFAYWTTDVLNEETLGEQLSSVDIIQFHSISALRQRIGDLIDGYLQSAYRSVDAPEGQEFYFMSTQTFVLATRYEARDLAEFAEALRDFILAVGDDHDDEELFGVLPPQAYSIRVGITHTGARNNLREPKEVVKLLETLTAAHALTWPAESPNMPLR